MGPKERYCISLVCLVLLWAPFKTTAYEGEFCDEPHPSIYCTCATRHGETTINCYISRPLPSDNEIWRSMSEAENVINLKLHSMLPMRLDYIPTQSLMGMKTLRILTILQGNMTTLQSNTVSGLPELRELILDGSEISRLETKAISNLPKLKKLSLSENLLQEVLADSLEGLDELEQLFLDRNNISRVEGYAFSALQNLKELELWGNQITDLTEYMFRGLRYLKRLDLYKNQIRILNDRIFHSMPKLQEIDLKDNLISHVAPHAFDGLEKLQRLMLNANKIKLLPDQVFKSLGSLRFVDLYYNDLETLQVEVLENMAHSKDEHFSLSFKENPLQCDCSLQWVHTYLQLNKSHQFTKELSELKCKPDGDEDTTLKTVHLLKMDCDAQTTTKQKSVVTTSRSVTQPAIKMVPYEIQGRKNKTRATTVDKEDVHLARDDEPLEEMADEVRKDDGGDSGSLEITGNVYLIGLTLVTLFLVRKRKGTLD